MRILFCFILLSGYAQEEELAKTNFPVRLTPEEEAAQKQMMEQPCAPLPPAACDPCCPLEMSTCPPPCCKARSINCPPVVPRFDPCDCIMDHYNPLVYNGWDLSVEWLFWTVQQKSSTFALTDNGIHQPFPPNNSLSDSTGEYQSAHFGWNSGVRAGLAYTFQRDAWNLLGQYTYYSTSNSHTAHRSDIATLYLEPTNKEIIVSPTGPHGIRSSARLSYQVADFLLSRRFLPATQILFNFFAGPTGAWIHERWKVQESDTAAVPNVETNIRNSWKFNGGGMRLGLDANWHLGAGFGLYNKASFATLVGSYTNRKNTSVSSTGGPNPLIDQLLLPNINDTIESEIWVVPATQLEFGLNWNYQFCDWAIALQGAFEVNTWYDLHQYHQDSQNLSPPNTNKLDYRNASPVSLWGASGKVNFSF